MIDPFQNVDDAGIDFAQATADTMEVRQSEPIMERIVSDYLGKLDFNNDSLSIEIGCGPGSISRRIARFAGNSKVLGFDPSANYIEMAKQSSEVNDNLAFFVADGQNIPIENGSADHVILHTVLSHVLEPKLLIAEANRLLKDGGQIVICDADFSKATLACSPDDPLSVISTAFVRSHVTDPHLLGKLNSFISNAGFAVQNFEMASRVVTRTGMRMWVESSVKAMLHRNEIGTTLADAFVAEYDRRVQNQTLYGFIPFFTFVARK